MPTAGFVETLERVGGLGLPLAVVMSSRWSRATFRLSHSRLAGHFRVPIAGEHVDRPKPAAALNRAAERVNCANPTRLSSSKTARVASPRRAPPG